MPIDVCNITSQQAEFILAQDEGHFLEMKSIDISPAKLTKVMSAFANADGGELYVGIRENREKGTKEWLGFKNVDVASGYIQAFESFFPLGQDFQYEFFNSNGCSGLCLKVSINKTLAAKKASDGNYYVRRGANSLPCDSDEKIRQLEYSKGVTSFENELVNCEVVNVANSETVIGFMLQVVPSAEPIDWLKKQQLIKNQKPTVASILLFSDEPQAILQKRCGVKIYRYKTSEVIGTRETLAFDPITIEGNMYKQIYSTVSVTKGIIEDMKRLGIDELESIVYPDETLHEIITNAVIHRDYSFTDDIHVRIFDNRVEVENPGRLPAHITPENILKERFARNPSVVRLINKFPNPPNKDVGEGLNTAFEAMERLKLKPPIIEQRDNSVFVKIKHEPLATPEELVLDYLTEFGEINNTKGREVCHEGSENKMKRVFERLTQRGLIERIPERRGKNIAYRKAKRN